MRVKLEKYPDVEPQIKRLEQKKSSFDAALRLDQMTKEMNDKLAQHTKLEAKIKDMKTQTARMKQILEFDSAVFLKEMYLEFSFFF